MGKASRECFAIAVDARKQCYQHVQAFGGAACHEKSVLDLDQVSRLPYRL
jgi:hypothetical protein